jgi:DNA-binding NarL/FixJ family response regulator
MAATKHISEAPGMEQTAVPEQVELRWPAYEALPPPLKKTAELLACQLPDEAIALHQGRPITAVREDVAQVFDRLSVRGRHELARLLRSA